MKRPSEFFSTYLDSETIIPDPFDDSRSSIELKIKTVDLDSVPYLKIHP